MKRDGKGKERARDGEIEERWDEEMKKRRKRDIPGDEAEEMKLR